MQKTVANLTPTLVNSMQTIMKRNTLIYKTLGLLSLLSILSLTACKQEDPREASSTEERTVHGPDEVAVSVQLEALRLPIDEEVNASTARAINVGTSDVTKDGKTNYSVISINRATGANKTLRVIGIFYSPTLKKAYYTDKENPMIWTLSESNAADPTKPLRYTCIQSGVVYIPSADLQAAKDWYFSGVLGADYDKNTGTLTFRPYAKYPGDETTFPDGPEKGFNYQSNLDAAGQQRHFDLDIPMSSDWVRLKLSADSDSPTFEHYFNPPNWVPGVGSKTTDAEIKFRPRGTLLRMRFRNATNQDLNVVDYKLSSNTLAFAATVKLSDFTTMGAITEGGKLKLTPVMGLNPRIDLTTSPGATKPGHFVQHAEFDNGIYRKGTGEDSQGATIAWVLINPDEQAKAKAEYDRRKAAGSAVGGSMPSLMIRATAVPSKSDVFHSMQKIADYYPLPQRISYISSMPVFYTGVDDPAKKFVDGAQQWFTIHINSNLSNLELTTFEPIAAGAYTGRVTFKNLHPWANYHNDDNTENWLDEVSYPNLRDTQTWLAGGNIFSNKDDRRILSDIPAGVDASQPIRSTAYYYVPYQEQIASYLPIPKDYQSRDNEMIRVNPGETKAPFEVDVCEPEFNRSRYGSSQINRITTARFTLKGGNVADVNKNFNRRITGPQRGMPVSNATEARDWTVNMGAEGYNFFNFFWATHVVYGLAYLEAGNPESLVAYRYLWGSSPTKASGLAPTDIYWEKDILYNSLILGDATGSKYIGTTEAQMINKRNFSAWSAGRPGRGGDGRAMVSVFTVALRRIGSNSDQIRSLKDIDIIAQESFWTERPDNVVFRIFSAIGFSESSSSGNNAGTNRNRGAYIMTQTTPAGGIAGQDYVYYYIDKNSWGRFNTNDSQKLLDDYLARARRTPNFNGYPGYDTRKARPAHYKAAWPSDTPPQLYSDQDAIERVYPKTGSGIPTRVMVGRRDNQMSAPRRY